MPPFPRGKGAIGYPDDRPIRPPALCLKDHLPCPTDYRLMPLPVFLPVTLTRSQTRQKRQSPGARRPRHRGQQHQTHPTQAARFHKMRVGTADRITVDAFGLDTLTPAALDGIVDTQHHRTGGHEPVDQKPEQDTARLTATPAGTVENAVIIDKPVLPAQAHDAQATRDGALAGREDGTEQQQPGLRPDPLAARLFGAFGGAI